MIDTTAVAWLSRTFEQSRHAKGVQILGVAAGRPTAGSLTSHLLSGHGPGTPVATIPSRRSPKETVAL
jgi:hypothetical protein